MLHVTSLAAGVCRVHVREVEGHCAPPQLAPLLNGHALLPLQPPDLNPLLLARSLQHQDLTVPLWTS